MATHQAPRTDAAANTDHEMARSVRPGLGHRVAFRGFDSADAARTYIMGKAGQVKVSGDTATLTCSQEETALRFSRACEIVGGHSWGVEYRGKGAGYRVEAILGLAWTKYFVN